MVRATIEIDESDYQRLKQAASDRGMTVENFVVAEAVRAVPPANKVASTENESATPDEDPRPPIGNTVRPFKSLQEWFDWVDSLDLKPSGWKWNREELYDRKVLR